LALFSFDPARAITTTASEPAPVIARARGEKASRGARGVDPFPPGKFFRNDGTPLSRDDLSDQFLVYQINREDTGPAILDATEVNARLTGSEDPPDVLARLNLISFHVGTADKIDPGTRATMRITFGKAPASRASQALDTAFWAVAAGMKLFAEGKAAQDKQLASDLNRAFANRPVEIAGGLGLLSFEVVKHEEPKWWQKLFTFLGSGTGKALTSALGFPGVTQPALALVDELLGRLSEEKHEVLFQSAPMRLALSQRAHDEFTGGSKRIKLGSLDDGHCLLARGRDRAALLEANPIFLPTLGVLAPAAMDSTHAVAVTSKANPLHALTYAVFRIQTKSAQLDPNFNFR
jgi:hypothetical protein